MSNYDVPLGRCHVRGCPVVFTSPSRHRRLCLMHHETDSGLSTQRRAFSIEVEDMISRAPTPTHSTGRVVR